MSTFNSKNLDEFKGIWVFCEQRQGKLMNTDFELLSEARKLADELNCELTGVLLGDGVAALANELGGYGADKVIVAESPLLKDYTTDAYAKVICDLVAERKPESFLLGASNIGRDLGPRLAARLHTGLCADCTSLNISADNYITFLKENSNVDTTNIAEEMVTKGIEKGLKMTRPAFGGHLMATIICPRFRPQMATVRPGVMKKQAFDEAKAKNVQIEVVKANVEEKDLETKVLEIVKETRALVDLIGAEVIVSVGRGISKDTEKGIALATELAACFGSKAVVGASRAVVDSGWISADHQVGQTGKTVRPKIYIALGISGAIQHKAGMSDSELIIAVNKNELAPIFEIADLGIVGDLFKVVPMMIEAINQEKAAK